MARFLYGEARDASLPEWTMDVQPPAPDLAAFLDAALALARLPLERELRERVLMHLGVAAGMADLVLAFPLSDEAEPAPVYEP